VISALFKINYYTSTRTLKVESRPLQLNIQILVKVSKSPNFHEFFQPLYFNAKLFINILKHIYDYI